MEEVNQPLVSVLMPAYNAKRFIRQAIDSILNQSYKNIELLIADDCSKDNTKQIIDSYTDNRIRRFYNEKNLGYLKTWNKIIAEAKGSYITFQDADDVSDLNRIELMLNAFKNDKALGACGSNYKRISEEDKEEYTSDFVLTHDEIVKKMPDVFDIVGSAIMITREVYDTIGGYNEFFDRMGAEDYYWIYLISEKFKLINLPEALYYYRSNKESLSGNLSDNYKKLFSFKLIQLLVNQRQTTGYDDLEANKQENLIAYLSDFEKPYEEDPSLFYRKMAAKYFHEGLKGRGIKLMFKAILKNPSKIENYKDLIYFIKTIFMNFIKKVLVFPINKYYKLFPDRWRIADWKKRRMPSPPPHIIKYKNILHFRKKFHTSVFIESGTFLGEMDYKVRNHFKEIYSIELDDNLFRNAKERFSTYNHINIIQGDSGQVLPIILEKINTNCLFWLDGHYSEGITAKGEKVTPIEKELEAISKHMFKRKLSHLIMIDDARLFNGTDDYPTLDKMHVLKNQLFPDYKLEIRHDAIILYQN